MWTIQPFPSCHNHLNKYLIQCSEVVTQIRRLNCVAMETGQQMGNLSQRDHSSEEAGWSYALYQHYYYIQCRSMSLLKWCWPLLTTQMVCHMEYMYKQPCISVKWTGVTIHNVKLIQYSTNSQRLRACKAMYIGWRVSSQNDPQQQWAAKADSEWKTFRLVISKKKTSMMQPIWTRFFSWRPP